MHIEWNKVTWYSKLVAIIVFVATFYIAYELGVISGSATQSALDAQRLSAESANVPLSHQ